jgi:hypothetical protein
MTIAWPERDAANNRTVLAAPVGRRDPAGSFQPGSGIMPESTP